MTALHQLAEAVPQSTDDLLALACAGINSDAALALWHEREGMHEHGCEVCDLEQWERAAERVMARRQLAAA